jgi:hypothetical protein
MDGFNDQLKDKDDANNCVGLYYRDMKAHNVKCYELGGDCLSNDEE